MSLLLVLWLLPSFAFLGEALVHGEPVARSLLRFGLLVGATLLLDGLAVVGLYAAFGVSFLPALAADSPHAGLRDALVAALPLGIGSALALLASRRGRHTRR